MGRRSAEEERAWQDVRRIVLERDRWTCQECQQRPPRNELDVHHLIPRAAGGHDVPSNCAVLCDGCHAGRHLNMQVSLARRTIERWALALAWFLDRGRELPEEARALSAGLRLFGVTRFREGQMDAVLGALRGESQLVVRPTGSGKSLCFQLPAILKGQPATFVLSPLKALMVDQTGGLHKLQLPATFINSDIGSSEKHARYELLEDGAWALVYMAPERFGARVKPQEVERLAAHRPSFLVVDEAHVVDSWGKDFRLDYSRIAEIRRLLGDPPVLAFTATAGVHTRERILQSLGIPEARVMVSKVDRPNIALARLYEASAKRRAEILAALLEKLPGRAMIFVPTTKVGHEVRAAMAAVGYDLKLFHGKLPKLEREHIQDRFAGRTDPPLTTIITTSAFSMGVDIPNVRLVVHWQHPSTVEDYLQEFGRAGRDGKPALALLFTKGKEDTGLLEWMARRNAEEIIAGGERSEGEAQETLGHRLARIRDMQVHVKQRDHCFRAELVEALEGPRPKQRRSLSRWLLDVVFSSHTRAESAGACCDHCQPALAQHIQTGSYTPGDPLAKRTTLWRRQGRNALAAIGCLLLLATVLGTFVVHDEPSATARVAGAFDAYVAKHRHEQRFRSPHVRAYRSYYIACAASRKRGQPSLCLLVHPYLPKGHMVSGSYRRSAGRRFDCTGDARRLHIC